eukprot:3274745-Pyramimonas_sp.AAC.1
MLAPSGRRGREGRQQGRASPPGGPPPCGRGALRPRRRSGVRRRGAGSRRRGVSRSRRRGVCVVVLSGLPRSAGC